MAPAFPNVDWYCDQCDEYLNDQPGFYDDGGSWTCTECGQSNSISSDAIIPESVMKEAAEFLANFDPKRFGSR